MRYPLKNEIQKLIVFSKEMVQGVHKVVVEHGRVLVDYDFSRLYIFELEVPLFD